MKKILITGSSGFIGFHLSNRLSNSNLVLGVDNHNNYYSSSIKKKNLKILLKNKNFSFKKIDLNNKKNLELVFKKFKPEIVYHLAGQPGVIYSFKNPKSYEVNNTRATNSLCNISKKYKIKKFIFGSSSSVYGDQKKFPITEDSKLKPKNPYAKTKLYSEKIVTKTFKLSKTKFIIFRFFTVYGPWGRPDMALYKFTNKILKNKNIDVYNKGEMYRSFTYIDDVVKAVIRILSKMDKLNSKKVPFKILNIGSNKSEKLSHFIELIEKNLKKNAIKNYLPIQMGDTNATKANLKELKNFTNYIPNTKIELGIKNFIVWYKKYMNIV